MSGDGRRVAAGFERLAALTPAGKKAVKEGARVLEAAERDVLSRLSRDEAQQLGALLGKIGRP